jgi:hypothetical protein
MSYLLELHEELYEELYEELHEKKEGVYYFFD